MDLALYNLQWLICHKTKPNQTKTSGIPMVYNLAPLTHRLKIKIDYVISPLFVK